MLNVILLGITSLLTDISTEMVYPILPFFLSSLGAGPGVLGIIEGIAESLASLLKVFSGYFSDKMRRRKPLAILGYGASTIGKLFLYVANSWFWVLTARIIDRFGKGIRTAPRDALIADSTKKTERGYAYGLHRAFDTLGAALGVLIAFYLIKNLSKTSYRPVFLYSLIPAFLGVIILFIIREQKALSSVPSNKLKFSFRSLPTKLRLFLLASFIFSLGNSSNQFLILRAKAFGFSLTSVLLLYLCYNLIYGVFSFPLGKLSDKFGRRRIIVLGYLIYSLVYGVFAFANQSWLFWVLFCVYGLYSAFTEGVEKAYLSEISPPELRGSVIGLHATLTGIGLLPASVIAGSLWQLFGFSVPFILGSVVGFGAATMMFFAVKY
ncbi:MAG: MFS transporter [candidate division WOR-3 bacterium]|nr:MFS transporter [candidate division WOR-3 bacterium]MDW7987450.1 MFS transporter [candidate division WOR-3 bacterium]